MYNIILDSYYMKVYLCLKSRWLLNGGRMKISVNQFAKDHGYSESTIKYYIKMKLLPKPIKQGGYSAGVSLFFDDNDHIKKLLDRISELKKFGYKLLEIQDILRKEQTSAETFPSEEYIQRGKRFYCVLDKIEEPGFEYFTSLRDRITPEFVKYHRLSKYATPNELREYAQEIEQRMLVAPDCLYKDKLLYKRYYDDYLAFLIMLHVQYKLTWEQLEALYKTQRKNLDKYFYFPDDKTTGWLGYEKQCTMNSFCLEMYDYFEVMENPLKPTWSYRYPSIVEFYRDFTDGNCAFLPIAFGPNAGSIFLKKFKREV